MLSFLIMSFLRVNESVSLPRVSLYPMYTRHRVWTAKFIVGTLKNSTFFLSAVNNIRESMVKKYAISFLPKFILHLGENVFQPRHFIQPFLQLFKVPSQRTVSSHHLFHGDVDVLFKSKKVFLQVAKFACTSDQSPCYLVLIYHLCKCDGNSITFKVSLQLSG